MDLINCPLDIPLSKKFKVCVCGGREFTNKYEIFKFLDRLHKHRQIDLIIHGDARGADRLAGEWAKSRNVDVKPVPADWGRFKNMAGPLRNLKMIKMNPSCVIAFPGGRGTADMIDKSKSADIPVYVFKLSYVINHIEGDIFQSKCDYIVNPVNSVGVMGAGLAHAFRMKYPLSCRTYNAFFKDVNKKWMMFEGSVIEDLAVPYIMSYPKERPIIFFPTKTHWKEMSKLEYIDHSLYHLKTLLKEHNIQSVAFPEVGCGLGGLKWNEIQPLFDKYLSGYKGYVEIYHKPNET